jgi:hypothetical protein
MQILGRLSVVLKFLLSFSFGNEFGQLRRPLVDLIAIFVDMRKISYLAR